MYDALVSKTSSEEFDLFTLDDVDACFEQFVQLKYAQRMQLPGNGQGIEITPYAAGHMLGGAIWKISKETEEVIYAVDFNHRKERHLNGTVLSNFQRPSLLITDAYNALVEQQSRRKREQQLIGISHTHARAHTHTHTRAHPYSA